MSEYTDEPLVAVIDPKSGCSNLSAGIIDIGVIYSQDEARHIVACVNALEGLSDDALIGGWCFRGIEAYAKGLEKQRDDLLALLLEVLPLVDAYGDARVSDRIRAAMEPKP